MCRARVWPDLPFATRYWFRMVTIPANDGDDADVPPTAISAPLAIDQVGCHGRRKRSRETSGTSAGLIVRDAGPGFATRAWRRSRLGAPSASCQPRPQGRIVPGFFGNIRERGCQGRNRSWGLQYEPPASFNSVPPPRSLPGVLAGKVTAGPWVATIFSPSSQPAAPESPEAFIQVMPCAFACWAKVL